jgi:hypothetical protein
MKPIASGSRFTFPIAAGLAGLPLWIEAPVWGLAVTVGAAAGAYSAWRQEVERRPAPANLLGNSFGPLDVAIAWRTSSGGFPAHRRGWRAVVTDGDLWLLPVRPSPLHGGDRDYVRVPLLDVVGCTMASESEVRVRFLDDEGRAQEARLYHVPQASALASALGHEGGLSSSASSFDLGPIE